MIKIAKAQTHNIPIRGSHVQRSANHPKHTLFRRPEINTAAREQGRPQVDLINEEEHARILDLIEDNTWPHRWDGTEETGDELIQRVREEQDKHSLWAALESEVSA